MKKCTKCKKEKDFCEFNKRSSASSGLSAQCKECNKQNLKNHYKKNKEYYRVKAKKYKDEFRDFINIHKETKGCFKCGESRHWVLDFHHLDDNKEYNIAEILQKSQSYTKLKTEMDKCEVVCSNCHRDLHYQERQQK